MNDRKQGNNPLHVKQHYASHALFFITLGFGMVFTLALFFNSIQADNDWVTDRIKRGTDTLLEAINPEYAIPNPMLDQINNTMTELREGISSEEDITQEFLDSYFWEQPAMGLETSTIEYVPRVTFNESRELQNRFGDRLADGFEIKQIDKGVLSPAAINSEYYPTLLESSNNDWGEVIGVDRAMTNPLIRVVLEQARDTGAIVSHTFFPLVDKGDQTMKSHYYQAIYDTGRVPDTIEERRAMLKGFVSIVSYYPLQKEFLGFYPETYQGMEILYFPINGSYQRMEKPASIQRGIDAGLILETTYFLNAQNGEPWMALSKANPELITSMQTSMRWWILALGMLFTMWISSMIFWYRKQSQKLLLQLNTRSSDLVEKIDQLNTKDQDLRESESRYQLVADNTSEIIYTHDLDGVCTYITPSITRHSGYKTDEYIGKRITDHLSEESAKNLQARLDSLKSAVNGNAEKVDMTSVDEYELICKDGSVKTLESNISLVLDDNGHPNGLMGVASPG